MKAIAWIALGTALVLVLFIGLALGAGILGYGYPGGMMGRWGGYGGPGGMMGGWAWGLGGLLGMALMTLVPLAFLALLVLGTFWLVRVASAPHTQPAPCFTCPTCNHSVQADWRNCPNCGRTLR